MQTFNCSVDSNWRAVTYSYGATNIALFFVQDGKCKDVSALQPELYTTYCDATSRTFYLTINNVTDYYIGITIQCRVTYNTGGSSERKCSINVQCKSLHSLNINVMYINNVRHISFIGI